MKKFLPCSRKPIQLSSSMMKKESFGKAPTVGGYGLGGVKGLKNLSSTLCSRVLEFLLYPRFNKLCFFSTMTNF